MNEKSGVIVLGSSGLMGNLLCEHIVGDEKFELIAGVDIVSSGFTTHNDISEVDLRRYESAKNFQCKQNSESDNVKNNLKSDKKLNNLKNKNKKNNLLHIVAVDFSVKSDIAKTLEFCKHNKCSLIVARTDLNAENVELIKSYSEYINIFYSGNLSMGVFACMELIKSLSSMLPDAKIEIVETHHKKKLDAPSGTTHMIINELKKCGHKTEVPTHSIRGGNIVGQHKIYFIYDNEMVTIEHVALNKGIFIDGAMLAIEFLAKNKNLNGLYDNHSIFGGKNG